MAVTANENYNFVVLLEKSPVILEKSQGSSAKKRKEEAAEILIQQWEEASGAKLTQSSLLKKIHNLKCRAKAAQQKGAKLQSWQSKISVLTSDTDEQTNSVILETIEVTEEYGPDKVPAKRGEYSTDLLDKSEETDVVSQNFISQFETEETKHLTKEQLERIVLLQKIQVLQLKKAKLERELNLDSLPVLLDLSALNASNVLK